MTAFENNRWRGYVKQKINKLIKNKHFFSKVCSRLVYGNLKTV